MRRIIFTALILLAARPDLQADDKIIAIVNKDSITQSEADVYLNIIQLQLSRQYQGKELEEKVQEEKKQLINKMVEDKIIIQEAKRKNLQARTDRVKFRIDEMKAAYASEIDFENSLKEKGLTVKDLENKLNDQMIMREVIEREVKAKIVISPEEVTKFYVKNKIELFTQPQTYTLESLYLEDEFIAASLEKDLKNGLGLEEGAKQYKATYAKDTVAIEQLRIEVQDEISRLLPGQISPAIKLEKGIYIFKLLEILPSKIQSLSEVQDRIFNYLSEEKFAVAMLEWIDSLKSKSYVDIK